ncbi:MAG TPA: hypothetical protein PKI59_00090 [Candidatus Cloacimonadota bacterium]|nr:hypothetical protein [Candidatus Cloacimonadota bacterium]
MITPVLRRIDYMIQIVAEALEKVYRYQKQLEKYSETTTSDQRRADVEAVLDELNEYASEFARSGELPPCSDIQVLFGLWCRLDNWYDILTGLKEDDYLAVMDEHNTYENPLGYLLQPRLQAEGCFPLQVIPTEKAAEFLKTFESELQKNL